MVILAAVVFALFIFFVVLSMTSRVHSTSQNEVLEARLAQFNASGRAVQNLSEIELSLSFFDRVLRPPLERLSKRLANLNPASRRAMIEDRLALAGYPGGLDSSTFFIAQLICAVIMAVLGYLLFLVLSSSGTTALLLAVVFLLLGYMLPLMLLNLSVSHHRKEILVSLPSALDLLTISVEAGLSFDSALTRVTEKYHNALANEFARALSEIRLGRPRLETLTDIADRCRVEELNTFIQAIVQSEQLGVGIANVLRVQSEEIRRRRRQRAEEAGQKAPLKMLFPMVFCIFPTLFVVLLGPAALRIAAEFH